MVKPMMILLVMFVHGKVTISVRLATFWNAMLCCVLKTAVYCTVTSLTTMLHSVPEDGSHYGDR